MPYSSGLITNTHKSGEMCGGESPNAVTIVVARENEVDNRWGTTLAVLVHAQHLQDAPTTGNTFPHKATQERW